MDGSNPRRGGRGRVFGMFCETWRAARQLHGDHVKVPCLE